MENYRFFPPILKVRAGETVRFNLQNPDIISHAITIPSARFSAVLRPGTRQAVDFVVTLLPGSYAIVCPVQEEGNHEELGMVGTLIVEAAR
jgi:plastocyanin